MAQTSLRKTAINLPGSAREQLIPLLNARLADALDYALQLKQAHWNVKGPQFVALHEMFDEQQAEVHEFADVMAERCVMLGGQARGTLTAVRAASTLQEYPLEASAEREHLKALAERLGTFGNAVRSAIDAAGELGDQDTADLFTEVSRGLDKQLWYLEAHLSD